MMQKVRRSAKDESGVTLVELLAAIAILSIIVTAFLAFFIQAANTNKQTNDMNEATFIAQGVMEEITYHSSEGLSVEKTKEKLETAADEFKIEPVFTEIDGSDLIKVVVTISEGKNVRAVMETRLPFGEGSSE